MRPPTLRLLAVLLLLLKERCFWFWSCGARAALGAAPYLVRSPRARCVSTTAARTLLDHPDRSAEEILGSVDALKVRSCMTLFEGVPAADPVFSQVISTFYGGERCPVTRARLDR